MALDFESRRSLLRNAMPAMRTKQPFFKHWFEEYSEVPEPDCCDIIAMRRQAFRPETQLTLHLGLTA